MTLTDWYVDKIRDFNCDKEKAQAFFSKLVEDGGGLGAIASPGDGTRSVWYSIHGEKNAPGQKVVRWSHDGLLGQVKFGEIAPDTLVANQLLAMPVSSCLRVTLFNGKAFWFIQIEKSIFRNLPGRRYWQLNLVFDRVDTAKNRPVDIVDEDDFSSTPVGEATINESVINTDTFFDMFATQTVINKDQAVQTSQVLEPVNQASAVPTNTANPVAEVLRQPIAEPSVAPNAFPPGKHEAAKILAARNAILKHLIEVGDNLATRNPLFRLGFVNSQGR